MGVDRRWHVVCAVVAHMGCAPGALNRVSTPPQPVERQALEHEATPRKVTAQPVVMPPHPVIEAYVAGLESILSESEKAELRAISLEGTYVGDAQRLRYLAADRAVRVFLPESLEATRNPELIEHARQIRALPPLMNPDTDAVAYEVVSAALAARERIDRERDAIRFGTPNRDTAQPTTGAQAEVKPSAIETAEGEVLPPAAGAVAALHEIDPDARAQYAEALAAYSDAYAQAFGVSKLHADSAATAAADAADAAELLTEAIARGADRALMVQVGLSLVQQMAEAARRREKVPLPRIKTEKPPEEP